METQITINSHAMLAIVKYVQRQYNDRTKALYN